MRTTRIPLVPLVVAALVLGSGCARTDWIQSTLVTVDVTGVWLGSMGTGNVSREVRLELEQQGPKATGYLRQVGPGMGIQPLLTGPVEGDIGGDVFTFRMTSGSARGEMTVNGDEMKGYVSMGSQQPISLRRVDSTVPRRSQP